MPMIPKVANYQSGWHGQNAAQPVRGYDRVPPAPRPAAPAPSAAPTLAPVKPMVASPAPAPVAPPKPAPVMKTAPTVMPAPTAQPVKPVTPSEEMM